jgi:hypothetical protein
MLSDSNFLPYGRSMLEGARKEFQKLMMMEDAMLIHRIMRAPEKRIFKIDIGNIPPNEVDSFMEQIINKMKKIPHVDPQTGNYNLNLILTTCWKIIIYQFAEVNHLQQLIHYRV